MLQCNASNSLASFSAYRMPCRSNLFIRSVFRLFRKPNGGSKCKSQNQPALYIFHDLLGLEPWIHVGLQCEWSLCIFSDVTDFNIFCVRFYQHNPAALPISCPVPKRPSMSGTGFPHLAASWQSPNQSSRCQQQNHPSSTICAEMEKRQ